MAEAQIPARAAVLVVDDEETVAITLREILAADGYAVDEATTVPEALAKLEQRHFDVALLDLQVGNESGLTVLARLQETSPDTIALILTGYGTLETAVQAMRQGASDYLMKPCNIAELKLAIVRGLEQQQRTRLVQSAETAADQLGTALNQFGDFLSLAAHELKTPLTSLLGWIELVQRQLATGSSEEAAERLSQVERQARRMTRQIDAFIQVGRVQRGEPVAALALSDLQSIVGRVVDDAHGMYTHHRLSVDMPDHSVTVQASALSIEQVLHNLLENAVKFSPGGGDLSVRLYVEGGDARITVHDNGIGIPSDELAQVFERFYQVDDNLMTRRFGGMGLGLYISRAVVEAQAGHIHAESPGHDQGSTFTISLPLAEGTKVTKPERRRFKSDKRPS